MSRSMNLMRTFLAPLLLAGLVLQGCYTYVPFHGLTVTPGMNISLELNDQGRVAVGERLGPELQRVDGALVEASDTNLVLLVSQVRDINGGTTRWSGEPVRLKQAYTKQIFERRLDKPKTGLFVAGVTALLGAFILTRNLTGWGDPHRGTKVPPDGHEPE